MNEKANVKKTDGSYFDSSYGSIRSDSLRQ